MALGTTTAHADDTPPTATPPTAPTDSTMVTIPDEQLSICVWEALGEPTYSDTYSTAELATITNLSCDLVSNLTGISAMTGLTSLDLWDGSISDVTPLAGLTGLQTLDIGGNAIGDLSPLAALASDGHTTIAAGEQRIDAGNPIDGVPFTLPVVKNPDGTQPELTTGQGMTISTDGLTATPTSEQTSGKITWGDTTSRTGFSGTISFVVYPGVCDFEQPTTILGNSNVGGQLYAGFIDFFAQLGPGVTAATKWFRNGVPVSTATYYINTPADYGTQISEETTLSKANCPDIVQFSGSETIGVAFPPTDYRKIASSSQVGVPITTKSYGWIPDDFRISYQWYRNNVAIPGATASSYVPQVSDLGTSIGVEWFKTVAGVTTDLGGTNASKIVAGSFPSNEPRITGTLQAGGRLSVILGTWLPGTTFTYQWYHGTRAVPGATAPTFTVPATDAGSTVYVDITASAPGYNTWENPTGAVKIASAFTKTAAPVIAGSPTVGSILKTQVGSWSPSGISFSYQWYRAGKAITGDVRPNYVVTTADVNKALTVTVTATKSGYAPVARTSRGVTPKLATIAKAPTPTISGTSSLGHALTANVGTWTAGVAVHLQWRHNGANIPGATGRSYGVAATDVGQAISVVVTGTRAGYTSVARVSSGKAVPVIAFKNCKALNAVYPHGVARAGVTYDLRSGKHQPVYAGTYFNTSLYNANPNRDADKDGIACEKP